MSEIFRNLSAYPGFFDGCRFFSRTVTADAGGARSYTVETGCQFVFFAFGWSKDTGLAVVTNPTTVPGAIENSTTYVGTKKVTFVIPASDDLHFIIIGSIERDSRLSITGDITEPLFDQGK